MNYIISVIIPVYNGEKYVKKCLDNILLQSFKEFEIIIVDDGSTDSSLFLCQNYAKNDKRILVIHQDNRGSSAARELGVKNASGKFCFFVDCDDWLETDALEKLYNKTIKDDIDVVCGLYKKVDAFGNIYYKEKCGAEIICYTKEDMIYNECCNLRLSTSVWGKLIKTDILKRITFRNNLPVGEDYDLVFSIIQLSKKILITDYYIYNYFYNPMSISHSGYNEKYDNSFENYIRLSNESCEILPKYKKQIKSFYSEGEMSVITAMCRNKKFNWILINKLRKELFSNLRYILLNKNTKFYYKISALLIVFFPRLFIFIFSIIRKSVKR